VSPLTELKQRRIWRVVLAYPSLVFVLLQVVEFFINYHRLDPRSPTASIITAVVRLQDARPEHENADKDSGIGTLLRLPLPAML
jgi:hypothetical protein